MKDLLLFFCCFFLCLQMVLGQNVIPLPSLREQAAIEQSFTDERVSTVLPMLMRKHGVKLWLISQRESGEDNVFWAVKSAVQFTARRRTVIIFYDNGDRVIRSDFIDYTDGIWDDINALLESYDPKNICLNTDSTFAFSDGLRTGEKEMLQRFILPKFQERFVVQPLLALDFIGTRTESMLPKFKEIMEAVWAVIDEGFSASVITPGVTHTNDVVWWFREKIQALGYQTWFQTSTNVYRQGFPGAISAVIQKGDMLWCDIGFVAYNLHTDTQHLGYVLKDNETDVPEGLKNGLRAANIMQDIIMRELKVGRTGNDILMSCIDSMRSMGIDGTFYSHPVDDYGHGAGPLIGYWDIQEPVPVQGDVPVIPNTYYSIELQATSAVPEWGNQPVSFPQEEDMSIDSFGTNSWVYGRQTEFHIVR